MKGELLQAAITRQAERRPEAVAVVHRDEALSYERLEEESNGLGRLLAQAGCQRGDRVGLVVPKSARSIVGIVGTLKADCAYVPLDTRGPAARLARVVEQCELRCVLATKSSAALLDELLAGCVYGRDVRIVWIEDEVPAGERPQTEFCWDDVISLGGAPVHPRNTPQDLAHILFTSGSTGVPKGVMITHANVGHFVAWATGYFGTRASDRISCHPPLHFDLSTFDIYGTLSSGAQLHLVPPETSLLPHRLADFMRDSELTQWFSVPSILSHMAALDAVRFDDFPSLERLIWCGEAFPVPGLVYWMKRLPRVSFTNLYGPTEATIASSFHSVAECPADDLEEIPIGTPCEGETLAVLDEEQRPVAPGEVGELCIGGVGLSPGYWRDREKTEAAFRQHPVEGGRIYRTGDLARVGGDGLLYLLGRADTQIKSRGYRIELGEIEAALHSLELVGGCAVVGIPSGALEGTAIGCAYVPASGVDAPPQTLRKRLAELVPHYMVPSRWLELESLPLNPNGKVDRPALRERLANGPRGGR